MQYKIVLVLILFISVNTMAQSDFTDDAAIWTGFELSKKINKKVYLSFSQQCRFDENITQLGRASFGIDGIYKLNKSFRLNYGYNYLKKIEYDLSYYNENRFVIGFTVKKKYRKWDFSYRNIAQIRYKKFLNSEDGKTPKIYNRNRIEVQYELNKRMAISNSYEIYVPLTKTELIEITRLRTITGFSYNLSKKTSLKTYFLFQRQFNSTQFILRNFVYGIEFSHEL